MTKLEAKQERALADDSAVLARARALRDEHYLKLAARIDRIFIVLLAAQWLLAIAVARIITPTTWEGMVGRTHPHVWFAIVVGGLLAVPPSLLGWLRPGAVLTRYAIAVAQMAFGALLIHLTGGRIETHFHVFGSLAFIAAYRDVRVLLVATAIVLVDHVGLGIFWPESIYAVTSVQPLRWLEHAAWVIFEDIFLLAMLANERHVVGQKQHELETLNHTLEARVVERTEALTASREQYRTLLETTQAVPWEMTPSFRVSYIGPQASRVLGYPAADLLEEGFFQRATHPEDLASVVTWLQGLGGEAGSAELELRLLTADGRPLWLRIFGNGVADANGQIIRRGFFLDDTARHLLEAELRSAQKLESVGRLAAGVAHEINTPVQFVSDGIHFVTGAFASLADVIRSFRQLVGAPPEALPTLLAQARAVDEASDTDYHLENVPESLESAREGLGRIATIVKALKDFSHPDRPQKHAVDLNANVKSTLIVAANEYKYVADVVSELGELPLVSCHAGEINQVLLNLVINAGHAIADVVEGTSRRGTITIRTWQEGGNVFIRVSDTGGGIPANIRHKIFEPFFTTKEVGKGTGQGLAIARSIVVDKHRGELTVETELGTGTAFLVRLPTVEVAAVRAAA